jgi:hypothetical protein
MVLGRPCGTRDERVYFGLAEKRLPVVARTACERVLYSLEGLKKSG